MRIPAWSQHHATPSPAATARVSILAASLVAAALAGLAAAAENESPAAGPPLIRRVLIAPERVPAELARADRGTLLQLPRRDFEGLVRRAQSAANARKHPPRLVAASYRATLKNSDLVGSGHW